MGFWFANTEQWCISDAPEANVGYLEPPVRRDLGSLIAMHFKHEASECWIPSACRAIAFAFPSDVAFQKCGRQALDTLSLLYVGALVP